MNARLIALLLAGVCACVQAQSLEDPTRPPAKLAPVNPQGQGGEPEAASSGPRLQSVLIGKGPGARHVAVIDGETVRLGQTFKGARLVRVTETEVELVHGTHKQILKLFPAAAAQADKPQH